MINAVTLYSPAQISKVQETQKKPEKQSLNSGTFTKSNSSEVVSFQGNLALKAITNAGIAIQKKSSVNIGQSRISNKTLGIQTKLNSILQKDSKRKMPVIKEVKPGFVQELAEKIAQNPDNTIKVAIAGRSASGKTYFANVIMDLVGEHQAPDSKKLAEIISCDNYYIPVKKNPDETLVNYLKRTGKELDSPQAVDLKRFSDDVNTLASGESISIPRLDFKNCLIVENEENKEPARVVLTEGLFTLDDSIKDNFDIKIYFERDGKDIKDFWMKRAPQRLPSLNERDFIWKEQLKGAIKYVEPTKKNADLVIEAKSSKEAISDIINDIFAVFTEATGKKKKAA